MVERILGGNGLNQKGDGRDWVLLGQNPKPAFVRFRTSCLDHFGLRHNQSGRFRTCDFPVPNRVFNQPNSALEKTPVVTTGAVNQSCSSVFQYAASTKCFHESWRARRDLNSSSAGLGRRGVRMSLSPA